MSEKTVFLAYPFRLAEIRRAVLAAAYGIATVICADDELTDLQLLDKIREMMHAADVCLFDLTDHNVNVAVEYGLARGLGLAPFILYKESEQDSAAGRSPDVFSDLRGLDSLRYSDSPGLTSSLRVRLPGLLQRQRRQSARSRGLPRLQMVLKGERLPNGATFLTGTIGNYGSAPANRISYALGGYIDPSPRSSRWARLGTLVPGQPPEPVRLRYDDIGMAAQSSGWEHILVEYKDDDGQRYVQRGRLFANRATTGVAYTFEGLTAPEETDRFQLPSVGLEDP